MPSNTWTCDDCCNAKLNVCELIQGPINPDTLFGASQILKMILCVGSRCNSNEMLAQMFIQTPQSPNTVATASPTRQSLDEDCTNLGGWERRDGIYVTTHHKKTEQAKEKKQRYGEYATTMIDEVQQIHCHIQDLMTWLENHDGQLDNKQQEVAELRHDLDILDGKVWRLQRKGSEQLDKINSQGQSLKDVEITLKELERNLVSSKNNFERKLQEGSSFYQWISEPLGRLLLSQTSVVTHFKALENSMEVIKGVQNTHTALFLQALAGIDDLSWGVTNLMDHVHNADFMIDSLCKIKATIDALRSDLDCLKGSRHALDVQTHTTLEEELMLVPDCLVPDHQAGVDGNNWSKTGHWLRTYWHGLAAPIFRVSHVLSYHIHELSIRAITTVSWSFRIHQSIFRAMLLGIGNGERPHNLQPVNTTPYQKINLHMSPFRLTFDLLNGHSNTINVLAFSSCGSYLASGGEDKLLIIWRVSDSMLLYALAFESPVTALVWHPNAPAILFCGCENGAVLRLKNFSATALSQRSISFGVRGQVRCIDYDSHLRRLAVGMGQLILVSAETPTGNFLGSIRLSPSEDVLCAGDDDRLWLQSLHFYDNGNKIVAAYLNHGVIAWDLCTRTQLWRIEPILQSPQIDSHHVGRCEPSPEEPNGVYPVAVSFLLQGGAIISGTSSGKVHVWEVGKKGMTQVLDQKGDIIQAVASFDSNESIVALGSSQKGDATYITIWRAGHTTIRGGSLNSLWIKIVYTATRGLLRLLSATTTVLNHTTNVLSEFLENGVHNTGTTNF
ncbi:hypothetical protein M404DRAFT_9132 [Pisolithus tinctorius Marx 270]|uniref:Uncharacterized protein n=1 Tax=Pisolithus tinctorius Marx 270 TaxID=870435 RepID=A0A0C3PB04_PISTI|nr:hypothetical protein M404DRAFT_9132 [Pisolithus tinctorius Marx 270]